MSRHATVRTLLGLLFGALTSAWPSSGNAETPEPTVTIWRVVPANFHDPEFDSETLEKLLDASTSKTVAVRKGDTLSGILQRHLNVSQRWTPAVYDRVLANVRETNGLSSSTDLKPGPILLPDIPATTKRIPGAGNPFYPQPQLSIGTRRETMSWNRESAAFEGRPFIENAKRKAARTELQLRRVPLSELANIRLSGPLDSGADLMNSMNFQPLNIPISINMEAESVVPSTYQLLTADERARLLKFLARPAATQPILVILDDSWPDTNAAVEAMRFVAQASGTIRRFFGLDVAPWGDSEDVSVLRDVTTTTFCNGCEYPALRLHSAMIKRALEPVVSIDRSKRVEIIYLPVNKAQQGAEFALREMLYVSLLARSVGPALSRKKPSPAGDGPHKVFKEEADRVVGQPTVASQLRPFDGKSMTTGSDKAIIEGVIDFMTLYAMASGRPFVVSLSWTIPNFLYPTYFRPNSLGIVLAAAGNDPNINIHRDLVQYAARSMSPGDVAAVQNSTTTTSPCTTSTFTSASDVPVFGFGFPGQVDSAICGTSFSTPRLGWFIAAREAIKGSVPVTDEDWNAWGTRQKVRLMKLQRLDQNGSSRYLVAPLRVLEEGSQ